MNYTRNGVISCVLVVAVAILLFSIYLRKSGSLKTFIPKLRGEVALNEKYVITSTNEGYPLIVKKDDPYVGIHVRFTGSIKSLFMRTAYALSKKGGIVLEVGAHFGYNVVNIGKKIGNEGRYYAYEPNPAIAECLKKNITLNNLDKIVRFKCIAISDKNSTYQVEDYTFASEDNINKEHHWATIAAESNTIDRELSEEAEQLSLILLDDVPGEEFDILRGANNTVSRSDGVIILIAFQKEASQKKCNPREELQRLQSLGFNFYTARTKGNIEPITIDKILSQKQTILILSRNKIIEKI